MTGTWSEDGVDDFGERMIDDVSRRISVADSPVGRDKTNTTASGGAVAAANALLFGRQRQVQHLREVHRQKIEQLRKERANDDDQLSSDDEHMIVERKRRESVQFMASLASPSSSSSAGKGGGVGGGAGIMIGSDGRMMTMIMSRRSVSFSPGALPHQQRHVGAPHLATSTRSRAHKQQQQQQHASGQIGSQSDQQKQQHQHAPSPDLPFRHSNRPVSPSDRSAHDTPSAQRTGASTPSSDSLTVLDIGSDKLPLRFFPDQRTTSGWRGVVQPKTKTLKLGGSRSTSRPDTPPSHRKAVRDNANPTVVVGSPGVALLRSGPAGNNNNNNNNTRSPQSRHRGGTPGFKKKVSLKKSHMTMFNTFREPEAVPAFHKHHHHNPTQEHITRALPNPLGDVDVAFLKPVAASAAPGARHGKHHALNPCAVFGSSSSSVKRQEKRVSAFFIDGKPADLLSDVRMIVLDNIHGNVHRRVERDAETSPERLPRRRVIGLSPAQLRAEKMWALEERKNRSRTSGGGAFADEDLEMDAAAEERARRREEAQKKAEERSAALAAKRRARALQKADANSGSGGGGGVHHQARSHQTYAGGASLVDGTSSDDDDLTAEDANFASLADEIVVVGGDVVGGKPLLLPRVRGRWDAMHDALKARYFSKPPPAVEPIGQALRVIPLAELCSMYRACVKEVKGALEMDHRIFASFVRTMLAALPGHHVATEDDIDKYYRIFDMNGSGGVSFVEALTTIVDFQTDRKETQFLHDVFNQMLIETGQAEAVEKGDLTARVPWRVLENSELVFAQVLRALNRSSRFPRVVEKTFSDCLAVSMRAAHIEAESAMCQESLEGLFWEQFRLLVCLDPELIVPLRTLRLQ